MSRALLLSSGWRALGSMAPRSLTVPANLPPAATSVMSGERMQQLAERLSPVSSGLVNSSRGFATSTIRRSDEDKGPAMDQAAMSRKVDPAEAAMKKAADEMAKKAASSKKKDSGKSEKEAAAKKAAAEKAAAAKAAAEKAAAEKAEKAAAEKAAAEKAAAEKAAAEKAAAEKAAAAKAAAEKAAAEKAAAEKAAAEKAAAAKAAAEKAAAEKAAAEKAAAEKAAAEKAAAEKAAAEKAAAEKAAADAAAEAAAIANMRDPIQELFLTSIRAYGSSGGLGAADAAAQDDLKAELERVARQYGIAAGEDVTAFPKFEFKDEPVDPINISQ